MSLLLVLSTNDQIIRVYYIGMLLVDLTIVLYFNILNTLSIYSEAVNSGSLYDVSNAAIIIPTVGLSWLFFLFAIMLYAKAFSSLKPAILSLLFIPVIIQNSLTSEIDKPPLIICFCFGFGVFIILETMYECIWKLKDHIKFQIRVFFMRLRMYGILLVLVLHWRRLALHAALVVYWLILWSMHFLTLSLFVQPSYEVAYALASVSHSCDSYIRIISFCYVVYFIARGFLAVIKGFFNDPNVYIDEEQDRPNGLRESVGFFLLSLYTNLANVDASKRMVLMELISLLLLSALVRSSFEAVEPYLLALHSAPMQKKKRHVVILLFCIVLMITAGFLGLQLYYLRERFPFSIPNLITIIQIICALILYTLYRYDSGCNDTWEELDDYVYYVKGACRTFEFVLIVAVLGYRIFDTSLEWTIFQLVMVCLHMYVNVYLPLRDGWRSISVRRLVNKKLNSLPIVNNAELDDVCAICLDEMQTARMTPCNHIFHKLCLKKWLKIQNKCPLCHSSILSV